MYRHFIVISDASVVAAMGTECAAEQNMFWEFHDAIFDNWSDANQNRFAYPWMQDMADDLGMDAVNFDECMQGERAFERVKASHFDAIERGIQSTPSVFVNGNLVQGDFEAFRQAIEAALDED